MTEFFSIGSFSFVVNSPQGVIIDLDNIRGFDSVLCENSKKIEISITLNNPLPLGKQVFVADSSQEYFHKNIWKIFKEDNFVTYQISYLDHPSIKTIEFGYLPNKSEIVINLTPINPSTPLYFNPFQHPYGVLMLTRLIQEHDGFLIHGSGILDNSKGYIFTGVSGIGKSTMASIWKSEGATVINDDRLFINLGQSGYEMYNTPMPHYNDFARKSSLNAIFLLSQSKTNYCTQIKGIKALSKVMANFMQQLYDPQMIKKQLDETELLIKTIPVFELGFKPDADIVHLIRSLNL